MLEQGIDTVVLGCTHYPFIIPLVKQIVGPEVRVIDPAPAVARQTARLLEMAGLRDTGSGSGNLRFFTSGEARRLVEQLPLLLGETGQVQQIVWMGKEIHYPGTDNPSE
jgi:glutamate racemase